MKKTLQGATTLRAQGSKQKLFSLRVQELTEIFGEGLSGGYKTQPPPLLIVGQFFH